MSYQMIKDLYDSITGNSNITALVSSSDIKVGWQNELSNYPSIVILGGGGNAVGRLGYHDVSGQIDENFSPDIEIYSQKSLKENYDILDQLSKVMISANYEKLSDNDLWDDTLSAHRKVTRWNKRKIYNK